jgi:hypothetical protein
MTFNPPAQLKKEEVAIIFIAVSASKLHPQACQQPL